MASGYAAGGYSQSTPGAQQARSPFRLGSNLTKYLQQPPPQYANAGVQGGPQKLGVQPTPTPGPPVNVAPGYSPTPHIAEPQGGSFAPRPPIGPPPPQLKGPPGGGNSATTTPPGPPALDSTAINNINTHTFDVGNQVGALNQSTGYAQTDLEKALAQLAYQQPRDELKAEQAANSRGALYSTVYGQQLGDIGHQYLTNQGNATDAFTRTAAGNAARIKALQGGEPLYNEGQAIASTLRAAAANQANKALGEPSKPLTPAQKTSAATLAAALATAHKTGKPVTTRTAGQTVITRPSGSQQATRTHGGMFGGTVRLSPAQAAALSKLVGGK